MTAEGYIARLESREAYFRALLKLHQEVTYSVWNWLQAGACQANEPVALERVRQAVRDALAADPDQPGATEKTLTQTTDQ